MTQQKKEQDSKVRSVILVQDSEYERMIEEMEKSGGHITDEVIALARKLSR